MGRLKSRIKLMVADKKIRLNPSYPCHPRSCFLLISEPNPERSVATLAQ